MSELLALSKLVPGAVCGTFRLREATHNATWDGYPYLRVVLEDFSGHLPAYAWREEVIAQLDLPDYSLVRICGQVRRFLGKLQIDVNSVQPLSQPAKRSAAALIPRGICLVPELLPTLLTAVEQVCWKKAENRILRWWEMAYRSPDFEAKILGRGVVAEDDAKAAAPGKFFQVSRVKILCYPWTTTIPSSQGLSYENSLRSYFPRPPRRYR